MEATKNFFESDSMYYIIFALSLILCVAIWIVVNKKLEKMDAERAENDFNPNEAEPITIEEQEKIYIDKEFDNFADLAFLARLEEKNPAKFAEILADKSLTEEKLAKIVAEARSSEIKM